MDGSGKDFRQPCRNFVSSCFLGLHGGDIRVRGSHVSDHRFLVPPGVCSHAVYTMSVAVMMNIRGGYGFSGGSEALEMGVVFLSLILIGPGTFTLPNLLFRKKE